MCTDKNVIKRSFSHIIHNGVSLNEINVLLHEFITPKGFVCTRVEIHPVKGLFSVIFILQSI